MIVHEEAVAKGVRRITALTGQPAHDAEAHGEKLLAQLAAAEKAQGDALAQAVADLTKQMAEHALPALVRTRLREGLTALQKAVKDQEKSRSKEAAGQVVEVARRIAEEATGPVIIAPVDGADANGLRTAMDVITKKHPDAALLLGAATDGKVAFLAAVPKPLIARGLKAGDWVKHVAQIAGGGGGGRPDMAQAGGKDPTKLEAALDAGRKFAAEKI